MREIVRRWLADSFIRNYLVYFSGSMLVAFCNYLYHPILGRLMPIAEFGEVEALMSLIGQVSIVFAAFSVVTVNMLATLEDEEEQRLLIGYLRRFAFIFVGVVVLLTLVFHKALENFFHFQTALPFLGLVLVLPFSAALTFRNAYLQAHHSFRQISTGNIISAIGKILFAVLFVTVGFKAFGAIAGMALAQGAAFAYLLSKTKASVFSKHAPAEGWSLSPQRIREEIRYGALVLLTTGFITFISMSDILWVKHYFSPEIAGMYSGISIVGNILFFACAPVSAVLLTTVRKSKTMAQNQAALKKSLLVILGLGIGGLFTFSVFHDFIIKLLIGSRYLELASLLPRLGVLMVVVAIINVVSYYFLALRRYEVVIPVGAGFVLGICLPLFFHATMAAVVTSLTISAILVLLTLCGLYVKINFIRHSGSQRGI